MVRIRHFEERVRVETAADRTEGYTHTADGEEATAVGIIALLREDDWFTSTYRNHHHAIARDIPLEAITGELLGRVTGVNGGKGGSMHVADQSRGMIGGFGIVAAGLPVAAGRRLRRQDARTGPRRGDASSGTAPSTRERGTKRSTSRLSSVSPSSSSARTTSTPRRPPSTITSTPRRSRRWRCPTASRPPRSTAWTSSPCGVRRSRPSNARAVVAGRRSSRR